MSSEGMKIMVEAAERASESSKDKHTKLGVIILDLGGKVLVQECNTFPKGIASHEERLERPIKYEYIEHAERNAIFEAARLGIALSETVMVLNSNPFPCTECSRAVIQAGVKMVVGRDIPQKASKKWDGSCTRGEELLREAGVVIVLLDANFYISSIVGETNHAQREFLCLITQPDFSITFPPSYK